jgi:FlaA1/EpsC-like NDP-sugar epimerase
LPRPMRLSTGSNPTPFDALTKNRMKTNRPDIAWNFFLPSPFKRFLFFLLLDIPVTIVSLYLSFLLYFELSTNISYYRLEMEVLPYFLAVKIGAFALLGMYRITWRYFSIVDLFRLTVALLLASLTLLGLSLVSGPLGSNAPFHLFAPLSGFPRTVILTDFTMCLILSFATRISKRIYLEVIRDSGLATSGKRTLIFGAGNTGDMILRDMVRNRFSEFYPVGFIDDDISMTGASLHGIRVLGTGKDLEEAIKRKKVEALIVAIPSLDRSIMGELYNSATKLGVHIIKIAPRVYDAGTPNIDLKALEDISVEDLVGRQAITVDSGEIAGFLGNRRVLITGAGGSIGSEIAVQVCGFKPAKIILFDIDETELHNLGLRLKRLFRSYESNVIFVTGDVRDETRVSEVFEEYKPEIVFHAAAYKHVPMMESNAGEAVKVNVFGTYTVAAASVKNHAEKFIMISSDKAVRPTSVMGATKRLAEFICEAFNGAGAPTIHPSVSSATRLYRGTRFVSVRFGNVLGSRGSVLPLFLDQLRHGEPLTVTHKEMKRYFMTIPEAVSLVLQAAVIGTGGEVLVLDMGEPVKVTEIAEQLVRMHGLEPGKDVAIKYTGMRPGEKLFEELLTAEEGTEATRHKKVYVAKKGQAYGLEDMRSILKEFDAVLRKPSVRNDIRIKELLRRHVIHYNEDSGEKSGDAPMATAGKHLLDLPVSRK